MINQFESKDTGFWALAEFGTAKFGDGRLTECLVKLADRLSTLPESSINQACGSWSEAKAAYRFFQNDSILESEILQAHVKKSVKEQSLMARY